MNFSLLKERKKKEKNWAVSQEYEFNSSLMYMDNEGFSSFLEDVFSGNQLVSMGYLYAPVIREFFKGEESEWLRFVLYIKNKKVIDIGPNAFSPLSQWDVASAIYAIEPLYEKISVWQKNKFGRSVFDNMLCFKTKAEEIIPELVGQIDGAIYCRNMLDHTPLWPFVLSAISAYAAKGCKLLFWSDLDHFGMADEGHYDITNNENLFKQLIKQLGFDVIREYRDTERNTLNWGCFAEKI